MHLTSLINLITTFVAKYSPKSTQPVVGTLQQSGIQLESLQYSVCAHSGGWMAGVHLWLSCQWVHTHFLWCVCVCGCLYCSWTCGNCGLTRSAETVCWSSFSISSLFFWHTLTTDNRQLTTLTVSPSYTAGWLINSSETQAMRWGLAGASEKEEKKWKFIEVYLSLLLLCYWFLQPGVINSLRYIELVHLGFMCSHENFVWKNSTNLFNQARSTPVFMVHGKIPRCYGFEKVKQKN